MFDEIAGKYDLLNHLFTFNMDKKWRRDIICKIANDNIKKDVIMDLASGTGDLTKELLNLNPVKLHSCDISSKMLEVQKNKLRNLEVHLSLANAEELPYDNNSIDIVTIGFGIRNFENLRVALKEISRVLKNFGLLIVLEMFSQQKMKKGIYNIYFSKLMPLIGNRISKSKYAYDYLFNSVDSFCTPKDFIKLCEELNFNLIGRKNNFLNIVNTLYLQKL
jgi:demethylmenaquinone methyltransferase/2-methoxy-6-polyprenyl-1,4-benzoquinol methylase